MLTKKLMMLPTDMALMTDDKFRPHVLHYAKNEEAFFDDFSDVFAKLTSLGCPFDNGTIEKKKDLSVMEQNSKDFRENKFFCFFELSFNLLPMIGHLWRRFRRFNI